MLPRPVIPAKAGIQTLRVSAIISRHRATLARCAWIPAFAGMTIRAAAFAVCIFAAPVFGGENAPLQTVTAHIGESALTIEVAKDDNARRVGLSKRQTLAADGGMLFVYQKPRVICLWMKDTHIPLEALFLKPDGEIINTAQMKPETLTSHCSSSPAKYALEINSRWREENNAVTVTRVVLSGL